MCLIFRRILGPYVLGWAPNHFVLGAQLAPGEKSLVCIPDKSAYWKSIFFISHPKHMLWVLKKTVSMRRFF